MFFRKLPCNNPARGPFGTGQTGQGPVCLTMAGHGWNGHVNRGGERTWRGTAVYVFGGTLREAGDSRKEEELWTY